MWFKHRAWIPVAWLLSLANIASVWFAARPGEPWHATTHGVLAVLFGVGAQRLAQRRRAAIEADVSEQVRDLEGRLADLDRLPAPDGRLAELEERLDFMERALVEVRGKLPPRP